MEIDENELKTIVKRVMNRIDGNGSAPDNNTPKAFALPSEVASTSFRKKCGCSKVGSASLNAGLCCDSLEDGYRGVFQDMERAVRAAHSAQQDLVALSLEKRDELIKAMRDGSEKKALALAKLAVEETGYGRVDDKFTKNLLASRKTPGTEVLTPKCFTGDRGLTLIERAPYGLIGAITPVTNPIATIICNSIGIIAGGNSVVFNPHPAAAKTSHAIVNVLNKAIENAGGPPNLICTIEKPSIESAQTLMKHSMIRLLVVTGGPAVVDVAMKSGKKVIAAGPGNPPAVVDETADLERAAKNIITGASFDNNIVCVLEKEIIAVKSIADKLKRELSKNGAYLINPWQTEQLRKIVLEKDMGPGKHAIINKNFVGQDANLILNEIGIRPKEDVKIIVPETPLDHPFLWTEMLMPVIPLARVDDVDIAIDFAKQVEHGYCHTATMHSRNIDKLSKMARVINTTIFIKNGPSIAGLGVGGEGFTSFSIASPTGEGLTNAYTFTRERRCTLVDSFRIS